MADLDRSLAFWERFLGRPARWRMTLDRPYLARVVGFPGITIDAAMIDLPGGVVLELLDYQLPHLDAGPFLSYGIQWIAFGIIAPIGLGYFVYSEIRQRRLEKAAAAAVRPEEPLTPEQKLADRYGRRR